jgi:hypothetical protein
MEPTLFEGDKVVCSFLEPTLWETSIKDNYVYVIVTRGDIVVKRVFNKLKEGKYLEVQSDNNFYDAYQISISDIREMWYVRAKISPFLPSPANTQNIVRDEVKQLQNIINKQNHLIYNLNETIKKLVERTK